MSIPIHKRKFYSFISHVHINKKIVDELETWFTNKAGIPIWYDAHFHQSGLKLTSELGNILEQCRSMIILLSKRSVESGWAEEEFDASHIQRETYRDAFRVISIKVEECEIPAFLEATKLIDMSNGFDLNVASELLLSLYPVDPALEVSSNRDVYISHAQNEGDIQVKNNLTKFFQLIMSRLKRQWKTPPKPQYVFYGTDLKDENKERNKIVRRLIQRVSVMPCLMGEDIRQGHIQQEIAKRVVGASIMIADVSEENLNTCIEAGMAMGAKVPLHLLAGGARRKPPFMFRDQQIWHYDNDVDLIGIVHNLVLPYRRHIVNY